jgi:hypothetical protein
MKSVLLLGAVGAAFSAAAPALADTVIDTTQTYGGDLQPFGEPDTATYGQTFLVGADNVLNNFSLFLDGPAASPLSFKAYLFAWDGSKASGPALYTSGIRQFGGSPFDNPAEFTFSTGNLQLLSGQRYVAFVSTSEVQDGNEISVFMPTSGDDGNLIPGGGLVYYNNGADFAALTTNTWDYTGGSFGDFWFKATLSAGTSSDVPETASWAMMVAGFGMAGAALRSQRRMTVRLG